MSFILTRFKNLVKWLVVGIIACILFFGGYITLLAISRQAALVLPAPTGQYAVGRVELDWTDPQRVDPLADQENARRELPVWIWYPAQVTPSQKPAPYFPLAWSSARNKDQGIGILIESDLTKIQTHSYENAALDQTQPSYPVLIMEPGMGPAIPDYTVLAENLASHGYIVVGINPTYTSNLVVFPDGRVVTRSSKGTIPDSASAAEIDQSANRIMAVWAQDVIFVMNRLELINLTQGNPLYQHLDLDHIGVFGHSFGGATSVAVCQQDPRCKAGANLDGTPFSTEENTPIPAPFLFMTEDYTNGCDQNCASIRQIADQVKPGPVFVLSMRGAGHFNFSDLPMRLVPAVRPLFSAAHYSGSIDPARAEQVVNAVLLAFFDHSLKDIDSQLLNGVSVRYPELQFP